MAHVQWNDSGFREQLHQHLEKNLDKAQEIIRANASANAAPGGAAQLQAISNDLHTTIFGAPDGPLNRIIGSPQPYSPHVELGGNLAGGGLGENPIMVTEAMRTWAWARHREEVGGKTWEGDSVYKAIALSHQLNFPHPFLRPALLDQKDEWVEAMTRPMGEGSGEAG